MFWIVADIYLYNLKKNISKIIQYSLLWNIVFQCSYLHFVSYSHVLHEGKQKNGGQVQLYWSGLSHFFIDS